MVRPILWRGSSGSSSLPRKYSLSCGGEAGRQGGREGGGVGGCGGGGSGGGGGRGKVCSSGRLAAAAAAARQAWLPRCPRRGPGPGCRAAPAPRPRTACRWSKWLAWSNTSSAARQMSLTAGREGRGRGAERRGEEGGRGKEGEAHHVWRDISPFFKAAREAGARGAHAGHGAASLAAGRPHALPRAPAPRLNAQAAAPVGAGSPGAPMPASLPSSGPPRPLPSLTRRHRLQRVVSAVRLRAQHDGVHPVQYRVGNVGGFRAAGREGRHAGRQGWGGQGWWARLVGRAGRRKGRPNPRGPISRGPAHRRCSNRDTPSSPPSGRRSHPGRQAHGCCRRRRRRSRQRQSPGLGGVRARVCPPHRVGRGVRIMVSTTRVMMEGLPRMAHVEIIAFCTMAIFSGT